jgi:hypothetical protein
MGYEVGSSVGPKINIESPAKHLKTFPHPQ